MSKGKSVDFSNLYVGIGYTFKRPDFLKQALMHRSVSADNNERLEFLGDSLLNLITAEYLYNTYPNYQEGELSRIRSQCVNKESLLLISRSFNISDYIQISDGERMGGGQNRPSILSDAVEAIIAGIYLDSDYTVVREIVIQWLKKIVLPSIENNQTKDSKTTLQEYLQGRHLSIPIYTLIETSGLAHNQTFKVECRINGLDIVTVAEGKNRRAAEQNAARMALDLIERS